MHATVMRDELRRAGWLVELVTLKRFPWLVEYLAHVVSRSRNLIRPLVWSDNLRVVVVDGAAVSQLVAREVVLVQLIEHPVATVSISRLST